jgi:hypothetical protein
MDVPGISFIRASTQIALKQGKQVFLRNHSFQILYHSCTYPRRVPGISMGAVGNYGLWAICLLISRLGDGTEKPTIS